MEPCPGYFVSLTVRKPNLWLFVGLRRLMGGLREWKLF
jgi:hypothetical protein